MEENYLASEIRAIGIRLDFLTSAVSRLEEQNENRRSSIDNVAHALRMEFQEDKKQCNQEFETVKREIESLKTQAAAFRWLGIIVGGTIATYFTLKIITPPNSHDPNPGKQANQQTLFL